MQTGSKKKVRNILIAVLVLAVLAGGFFAVRHFLPGKSADSAGTAYVTGVADLMGVGGSTLNRFAGVVESQETWSVKQNPEYTVKEVFVSVGDEVKVGTPLFEYDVEKFETDLAQGEIDLARLENELQSLHNVRDQLEKDSKKAPASEKANYTVQIAEQDLSIRQKEIDIETKKLDNEKLKENMEHATVESELEGVVKTINSGNNQNYYGGQDDSFITVMQVGDFRVKGTINEQNMYDIMVGEPVVVHSRVDASQIWRGVIDKIDTENAQSGQNMYYGGGDTETQSSKYPFYVKLDSSEGLMLGQHVYMERDLGQADKPQDEVRLGEFYIDMTDPDAPFVWVDEDGKLAKRPVVLGEYNEEMMEYVITSGLALTDAVAFPEEGLREGMPTADISEMPVDDGGMMTEDGMMEDGMPEDGMMMDEGMPEDGMMEEIPEEQGVG